MRWRSPHALVLLLTAAWGCSASQRDVAGTRTSSRRPEAKGTSSAVPEPPPPPEKRGAEGARPRFLARATSRVLVLDETRVFYGDHAEDGLFAIAKTGGEAVRIARRAPVAGALAVDGEMLTWVGSPGDAVLRVSTGGGAVTTIRERGMYSGVAARGGDVFVVEIVSGGGALMRSTGATSTKLASFDEPPRAVVADDRAVFVTSTTKLWRVPRDRGGVETLASGQGFASLQITGTSLVCFAIDQGAGAVLRVPTAGGNAAVVAKNVRAAPIAVVGNEVLFFDAELPQVRSTTLDGAEPRVVATHDALSHPNAIAADETTLFVAVADGPILAFARR